MTPCFLRLLVLLLAAALVAVLRGRGWPSGPSRCRAGVEGIPLPQLGLFGVVGQPVPSRALLRVRPVRSGMDRAVERGKSHTASRGDAASQVETASRATSSRAARTDIPSADGAITEYVHETSSSGGTRKIVFVNGMGDTGEHHAASALELSRVQMCPVIGVYNLSGGALADLAESVGDLKQARGRSLATAIVAMAGSTADASRLAAAARVVLGRNPAQVALFELLREPGNRPREIFAHSQGCLILCNVLRAIEVVDGLAAVRGRVVHAFGSPAVNWPNGITRHDYAFTWDPVTYLAAFDRSRSLARVSLPSGSLCPIKHRFLQYLKHDAEFVVNRCRSSLRGTTSGLDHESLAASLSQMGRNLSRVRAVFEHLAFHHPREVGIVVSLYLAEVRGEPAIASALHREPGLDAVLRRAMAEEAPLARGFLLQRVLALP